MTDLNQIASELRQPFSMEELEVRVGSKTKDKSKATVIVYTGIQPIQERLDRIVGVAGWEVTYLPVGTAGIEARLSILGVTKSATADLGDRGADRGEPIGLMSAEARAFKRAASAFGIGRYLWSESKQVWAELDNSGFNFKDSKESLVGRVLGGQPAPVRQGNDESRQARQEPRPIRPQAPAQGGDRPLSPGQINMLKSHKVPDELIPMVTSQMAKGKAYKGEGLLDELKDRKDELGKEYSVDDALAILAQHGLKPSAPTRPVAANDIEDYDDYEDDEDM